MFTALRFVANYEYLIVGSVSCPDFSSSPAGFGNGLGECAACRERWACYLFMNDLGRLGSQRGLRGSCLLLNGLDGLSCQCGFVKVCCAGINDGEITLFSRYHGALPRHTCKCVFMSSLAYSYTDWVRLSSCECLFIPSTAQTDWIDVSRCEYVFMSSMTWTRAT